MGEHLPYKQGVASSSLAPPTHPPHPAGPWRRPGSLNPVSRATRSFWAFVALGVAAGLLLVADATLYLNRAVLDSDAFASRAVDSLDRKPVHDAVARQISDRLSEEFGVSSDAIRPVVNRAIDTAAFRNLFRRAALRVHDSALDERHRQVVLVVTGFGPLLQEEIGQVSPDLAAYIPDDLSVRVASVSKQVDSVLGDVARFADKSRLIGRLTLVFGLLLLAGSVVLHPSRRTATFRSGVALAFLGLFYVVVCLISRAAFVDRVDNPEIHSAAGAVWDAFFADFRTANVVIAVIGAGLAAGALLAGRDRGRRPGVS